MRLISLAPMVFAATILAAGVSALAGNASAAEARMSDEDFWNASRCAGIAHGLGEDTRALDAYLDRQSLLRSSYIADRGAELAKDGADLGKRGGLARDRAQHEHDGYCQTYLHGSAVTSNGR